MVSPILQETSSGSSYEDLRFPKVAKEGKPHARILPGLCCATFVNVPMAKATDVVKGRFK